MPRGCNGYVRNSLYAETIQKSELAKRDERISKLTNQYTSEHEVRTKTERERSQLSQELVRSDYVTAINARGLYFLVRT